MATTFPYLEVKGTHKDIGTAIGETFRSQIYSQILQRKHSIADYAHHVERTYPYFLTTLKTFPEYTEEMAGIAIAAHVEMADYFFLNTPEVYPDAEISGMQPEHCTTAVSRNPHGFIIGHTEDWYPSAIDDLFVLKASVGTISFLCLDYAIYLSGSSASVNSYGLVQCINELHSKPTIGIPKYIAARAILDCESLDQTRAVLKNNSWASGYNHVLIQNQTLLNIEMTADAMGLTEVSSDTFVHTNHFESPQARPFETFRSRSSVERYNRARELVKPNMDFRQMQALLSDTQNKDYPINKPGETIAAVILDSQKKSLSVCRGRPNEGQFVTYRI